MQEELKELIVDPLEQTEQRHKRVPVWNNEESDYITQLWNENFCNIGSQKGFLTKRNLYEYMSKKLREKFGVNRTAAQCEYKLLSIQKRTNNMLKRKRSKRTYEDDSSDDGNSMSDNPKTGSHSRGNSDESFQSSSNVIAQTIRDTMLEINSLKEQEKERRHREKMQLLERFLVREADKSAPLTKTTEAMTMREQLLEAHRRKMAEKERRHREKLEALEKLQRS